MYRRGKYNLNTMSHDTAIGLIQLAIDKGVQVVQFCHTVVSELKKYATPNLKKLTNVLFTNGHKYVSQCSFSDYRYFLSSVSGFGPVVSVLYGLRNTDPDLGVDYRYRHVLDRVGWSKGVFSEVDS